VIDAKAQTLAQAAQKLGEKMYADAQAQQGAAGDAGGAQAESAKTDDNVVDAEFTEVKDKKDGTGR
jgi:molecular chaperone DnaK